MRSKQPAVVQLDVFSASAGHDKEQITISDDDPTKRAQLAEKVTALIRDGFRVALADGTLVAGYDPQSNEWLVKHSRTSKEVSRANAGERAATAVAPARGG